MENRADTPAATADCAAASHSASVGASLLRVEDLRVHFRTPEGVARAVDGVDFSIGPGRAMGLVGESGCGKSVTALSILKLVPMPPARIVSGRAIFEGRDLLALDEKALQQVRGARVGFIFQEPMTSLNPVFTVGDQVAEVFRLHRRGISRREAWDRAVEMLRKVRIPAPEARAKDYPHQLSGGMLQRVMIAMALACDPALLIADEPTTALDVTIQAQILELMFDLQESTGAAILFISHDLGVVSEIAHEIAVMYGGMIVEHGPARRIFEKPAHPYTIALLRSIPKIGRSAAEGRLEAIAGSVPSATNWPAGCRFHPRCPYMKDECRGAIPPLAPFEDGHAARCLFSKEIVATAQDAGALRPPLPLSHPT